MKYFHNASITLYTKENQQESVEALSKLISEILSPNEKEKGDITINLETLSGFSDFSDTMYKIQIVVTSQKLTEKLVQHIRNSCAALFDTLVLTHISDEAESYVRFEIEPFLLGKFQPIEHGTGIQLKLHIAAYPAKKEAAIRSYESFVREKH